MPLKPNFRLIPGTPENPFLVPGASYEFLIRSRALLCYLYRFEKTKKLIFFPLSSSTGTTTGTTPTTVGHETSTKVASTTVVSSSASESATSSEHKSCIEKAWREGVDYFKVENSIVCHDGESIQGSHGECINNLM